MKKLFLLLLSLSLACVAHAQEDGWALVWHDEFDGTGAVDSAWWSPETGFVRNHELQWYQPQNAYRLDGVLVLEGRKDSIPNPRYRQGATDWRETRAVAHYSSACIHTRGHYAFLYGRLEVRARIPAVSGAWPAIWTLGEEMPWPSCGELDLMEFYQIEGRPHILANAAWGDDWNRAVWNSKTLPFDHFLARDPSWAAQFHVWRMDWDEDSIVMTLDGERLNVIALDQSGNGAFAQGRNPFRQPHYILLDLAIGGDHGGDPIADAFPMRYEVDYVRVYQQTGKGNTVSDGRKPRGGNRE